MRLAGLSLVDAAAQHGTPLFLFDAETLSSAISGYDAAFAPFQPVIVGYAVKACGHPAVLHVLRTVPPVLHSAADARIAERAGLSIVRGWMHVKDVDESDLAEVLALGIRRVVMADLAAIDTVARADRRGDLEVWLSYATPSGIGSEPLYAINSVLESAREVLRHARLRLTGLHTHIGPQQDVTQFQRAAHSQVEIARSMEEKLDVRIQTLCLGGGLSIGTTRLDRAPSMNAYASAIAHAVRADSSDTGHTIAVEPGRSLVGRAGIAVCRVTGRDLVGARSRIVIEIPGDHPLARLMLVEPHDVIGVHHVRSSDGVLADVHAATGEALAVAVSLGDVRVGELVAIAATGAYAVALGDRDRVLLIR